ncbi:MAG TPA: SDR family oxidoreductase [Bauldia sp.]|nr:SDR family oxidoreductase [Bauldia sp.]
MDATQPRTAPQSSFHTAVTSLKGKRVMVTGGTTGIGRAIAGLLASEEARVFTFGRHRMELDDALAAIRSAGGEVEGTVADIASARDIAAAFTASDRFLGGLDILVNNAGVSVDGLADMAEAEWRYGLEVDLAGQLACTMEAVTRMPKAGGHVVFVGSVSADTRGANSSVYVAAKAGLQAFAESFRKEVARRHVKVTLIQPGTVGTNMHETHPAGQRGEIAKEEILRAEDIAVAVHYVLTQPSRTVVDRLDITPLMQTD